MDSSLKILDKNWSNGSLCTMSRGPTMLHGPALSFGSRDLFKHIKCALRAKSSKDSSFDTVHCDQPWTSSVIPERLCHGCHIWAFICLTYQATVAFCTFLIANFCWQRCLEFQGSGSHERVSLHFTIKALSHWRSFCWAQSIILLQFITGSMPPEGWEVHLSVPFRHLTPFPIRRNITCCLHQSQGDRLAARDAWSWD